MNPQPLPINQEYISKNKRKLRVATWNADLIGRYSCDEIKQYCLNNNILILCIQESGAGEYHKPKFDNYTWYDKWNEKHKHDIGIMVRKLMACAVDDITHEMACDKCYSCE